VRSKPNGSRTVGSCIYCCIRSSCRLTGIIRSSSCPGCIIASSRRLSSIPGCGSYVRGQPKSSCTVGSIPAGVIRSSSCQASIIRSSSR